MKKHSLFLLALVLLGVSDNLLAQGTAFTYQGQLQNNTSPANGNYDFSFALFNNNSTNSGQVAATLIDTNVGVTNGLFTVTLDFGSVFTGNTYWLSIAVRTNSGSSFTALNPLQELTPTPYAIYAPYAGSAASANAVAATNITGGITLAQLPSSVVTNNQVNLNLSGTFSGNGTGLTNTRGTVFWQASSMATIQAQPNSGYLLTNTQQLTLTLPASPNVGDVVQVVGVGSGGWMLAQNVGQWISGSFTPIWLGIGAPIELWQFIASSSDGTRLTAAAANGGIYASSDSGTTWTQQAAAPTSSNFVSIA